MRHFAMTGMVTASMIERIRVGSDIRATPPSLRMSAGTRSRAITAQAPASWAILACSGVTTSMITPPFSIWARPDFSLKVPLVARCPLPLREPLRSAIGRNSTPGLGGLPSVESNQQGLSSVKCSMDRFADLSAAALHACGTAGGTAHAAVGGAAQAGVGGGDVLGFSVPGLGMIGFIVSAVGLVVLAVGVAVVLLLDARRRPGMMAAVPVDARLSPDGYYWWDGAEWRSRLSSPAEEAPPDAVGRLGWAESVQLR